MENSININLTTLGESSIQEAEKKVKVFPKRNKIKLHFIGHLQSNKARKAVDIFDVIQTVDSLKLAEKIDYISKEKQKEQLKRCSEIHDNVIVIDLRQEENIWAGNRFMVYALYPNCNISAHVIWGKNKQNTVIAVGKSIINRSSKIHVGELMLKYGGGGHEAAGTCQVENLKAEQVLEEIVEKAREK